MALRPHVWTKYSDNGSNCVEVMLASSEVLVRNSNHPKSGTVAFTLAEWRAHTEGHRLGAFDLPAGTL
ncbi:DUF397 domain-containing protein [Actinokineospora sp. NBRC 105648]|uniref:DUF397 domain-containing protein n=1 Tax=Actinokineospora sp. NBRC 105648 TaxID=3032206 RepID=UPI0024A38101|nr:DUF397 domain-containing protein [Actinokineospora sp. NBRC 105648]GLZ37741.1 hypothetical protein Acsp05_13660 [Actinokineospora sp. NBRC 105648]